MKAICSRKENDMERLNKARSYIENAMIFIEVNNRILQKEGIEINPPLYPVDLINGFLRKATDCFSTCEGNGKGR